jgi:hypothetical protein
MFRSNILPTYSGFEICSFTNRLLYIGPLPGGWSWDPRRGGKERNSAIAIGERRTKMGRSRPIRGTFCLSSTFCGNPFHNFTWSLMSILLLSYRLRLDLPNYLVLSWDLRFPRPWILKLLSSGMWRRIVCYVGTNVSQEFAASICEVEEMHGDGGSRFPPVDTASHLRTVSQRNVLCIPVFPIPATCPVHPMVFYLSFVYLTTLSL